MHHLSREGTMKISIRLAGFVAASAFAAAGALSPAQAASPMTDAFIANVRPNVVFLDSTSRMALDKSPSRAVRAFAHGEAKQQTIAANSITAWVQTNTARGEAVALGYPAVASPLEPVTSVALLPLDVANGVTNGVGDVITGRSVAIDRPLTVTPAPVAGPTSDSTIGSELLPSERSDMARLDSMQGRAFDALYRSTQLDGLRQLAALYSGYAVNGDDPALRAIAATELPRIKARIVELRRL